MASRKAPAIGIRLGWLLVLPFLLIASSGAGHAAPLTQQGSIIVVNTFLDVKKGNDGSCSLREAIIAANSNDKAGGKPGECAAGSGADTIMLDVGTYALARSDNGNEDASATCDLDISDDTIITGHGFGTTIIDANGISDRAFHILDGVVEINNITIIKYGTLCFRFPTFRDMYNNEASS